MEYLIVKYVYQRIGQMTKYWSLLIHITLQASKVVGLYVNKEIQHLEGAMNVYHVSTLYAKVVYI